MKYKKLYYLFLTLFTLSVIGTIWKICETDMSSDTFYKGLIFPVTVTVILGMVTSIMFNRWCPESNIFLKKKK